MFRTRFVRIVASLAFASLLGIAAASAAEPATADLPADEKQAGFVSLFNGRDFSGWRFVGKTGTTESPPNWTVRDGVIALSGGGSPHLASERPYADFEMRFEWRAVNEGNGYNSGFYIRSGENLRTNQINLAKGAEGKLMYGTGMGGDGVPQLQKPAGQWNAWRIVVEGDGASFWCNDEKAWDAENITPASGFVGLQAEGAAMEFRNLRIREIKK